MDVDVVEDQKVFSQFTVKTVLFNLYNCLELFHTEVDLFVLANIQAFMSTEETRKKIKKSTIQLSVPLSTHL